MKENRKYLGSDEILEILIFFLIRDGIQYATEFILQNFFPFCFQKPKIFES